MGAVMPGTLLSTRHHIDHLPGQCCLFQRTAGLEVVFVWLVSCWSFRQILFPCVHFKRGRAQGIWEIQLDYLAANHYKPKHLVCAISSSRFLRLFLAEHRWCSISHVQWVVWHYYLSWEQDKFRLCNRPVIFPSTSSPPWEPIFCRACHLEWRSLKRQGSSLLCTLIWALWMTRVFGGTQRRLGLVLGKVISRRLGV